MGVARRALDEATKYALERKTFGVPIFEVSSSPLALSVANNKINTTDCICMSFFTLEVPAVIWVPSVL